MSDVIRDFKHELTTFEQDLASKLSTRVDLRVFEELPVKLNSGTVPLNHVAKISLKNPHLLQITFLQPDAIKQTKRALELANMGVNPQQQGQVQ